MEGGGGARDTVKQKGAGRGVRARYTGGRAAHKATRDHCAQTSCKIY